MYLDTIDPLYWTVGWGRLGLGGDLGYEGKRVIVARQPYVHALSAHAPSSVVFHLGGRYAKFRSRVALNDDVPRGYAQADFHVIADGRRVATVERVGTRTPARVIEADISGTQTLELAVSASRLEFAHAVWLDPYLDLPPTAPGIFVDCLRRAEIALQPGLEADRCIATVVTPGFEAMLDDMLGSLVANGGCAGTALFVFVVGESERCHAVAAKYDAQPIQCRSISKVDAAIKSILYSIAHVVNARHYLCLDADMLVTGDLNPIFAALEALPARTILTCRDCNAERFGDLGRALRTAYGGGNGDAALLGMTDAEHGYPLVVNDGLFAGSRAAILALDDTLRGIPNAATWVDARADASYRNQFLFNLALARLDAGVRIDDTWNVQLHSQEVEWDQSTRQVVAWWKGRRARVVHFTGSSKRNYPSVQGRCAAKRPLRGPAPGDGYAEFLSAMRSWAGAAGADAMSWSFYGTIADAGGLFPDVSVFPLLATLHYLIRSNGCARVIESGTGHGVSTACIASAIAHRRGARVVTLDIANDDRRGELWRALPSRMHDCIEARVVDAIAGLTIALQSGERFQAALLDSIHLEDHVLAEFDLARQLVCRNGLILIHDATYACGTVDRALDRIEREGYNVARLWAAEEGEREDDHLGLAVIENRRRT